MRAGLAAAAAAAFVLASPAAAEADLSGFWAPQFGEIDFILKIVSKDLQSFQEFLTSKLTPAPNVASVKTSLTIRTAKNEPGVPLE